jgi:major vault protein
MADKAQPSSVSVIRIKPNHYIHVLDNNTNVTRVEIGPKTFSRLDHERVLGNPEPMIMIPPRHYCIIDNPVIKNAAGKPELDAYGQIKLRHGDQEIRFHQDPFPLFPGEVLSGKPTPLQVVQANHALRLRAIRDFQETLADGKTKVKRLAGDEWLFEGPATYIPRVEVQVVEVIKAIIIKDNQALRLRARLATVDKKGAARAAGEEWLVRETGAYLPGVHEEVIGTINAYVLTEKTALHLCATRTFTDVLGKKRKAGEEWLVTIKDSETHIPDVYEQVIGIVQAHTLNSRQFCVVVDPVDPRTGKNVLGHRELRRGDITFFLLPGERLERGIQNVYVLAEEEALLLVAREAFEDVVSKQKVLRKPGDRWMIYGPCDYIPPIHVDVIEKRKAIPLDVNEGIYVRDISTGSVKSITGQSYMLKPNEELWAKELPKIVDDLLRKAPSRDQSDALHMDTERDPTRVVTYRVPHNAAVQIYDYKKKKARVIFGPELVMLGPDEQFTVLNLSGGVPKRPNHIKSLALFLGPDFMTDLITVETADHARLSLKLSYNWHFEVIDPHDVENSSKIFSTPDFTGDLCKAIGSLVRAAVASSSFDDFHKHSSDIIHNAVFGKTKDRLLFPTNNLAVTNIDVQSVEPVDQRTLDSLQKSVQLAIEITTKSQEAAARQEAERLEQEARGRLERQRINDEAEAEKARRRLLQLQAQSAAVESTGQATAEAKARAEAAFIEGAADVQQARLAAEAAAIQAAAELEQLKLRQEAELTHQQALNDLELQRAKELADIEAQKFKEIVDAIGADTIAAIARAGPEMQAKLLTGLGLKSFMITDGHTPINLFNTANGLIGGLGAPRQDNVSDVSSDA